MPEKQAASLDTSFWTAGHRADVLSYLFSYFAIYVAPAVRGEVLAEDPVYTRRRYGYAEIFRLLEEQGLLPTAKPSSVRVRFGRGEAEAVALAEERGWWLLINDHRPLAEARERGVRIVSVPAFIAILFEMGVLSRLSAERKLSLIAPITSAALMDPIREGIEKLTIQREERR